MDGDHNEIDRKANDNKKRETDAQSIDGRALNLVNGRFLAVHLAVAVVVSLTIELHFARISKFVSWLVFAPGNVLSRYTN